MEELTTTLFKLLYDREFRKKLELKCSKEELEDEFKDFKTLDWKQLNSFADSIESKTFQIPIVMGKNLEIAFSDSIEALRKTKPEYKKFFLLSSTFSKYSDLNHSREFLSLEDAFYQFICQERPELEEQARHEFLTIHLQNLAVHTQPGFQIESSIQCLSNGLCSIQTFKTEIRIYACIEGKFISGPIDIDTSKVIHKYFIGQSDLISLEDQSLVDGLCEIGFKPAHLIMHG